MRRSAGTLDEPLHGQAVVREAEGEPQLDGGMVADEHVDPPKGECENAGSPRRRMQRVCGTARRASRRSPRSHAVMRCCRNLWSARRTRVPLRRFARARPARPAAGGCPVTKLAEAHEYT